MGKQIGRRYKAGEIAEYDSVYNLHRVRSTILNSGNRTIWNMHETSDLTGLKNTLHVYIVPARKLRNAQSLTRQGQTQGFPSF
jgi:hypothetical protein